jgi:predicted house-cleaning noncanonical NTP pyrophosphatase (MazG superfamily)
MKKVFYRKLIRDKIPEKMRRLGKVFKVRTLGAKEFRRELLKKVGEEASALPTLKKKGDILAELADVQDVVDAVRKEFGITNIELKRAQAANASKKGGFRARIYLEWSESDDYQTNERKGKRR